MYSDMMLKFCTALANSIRIHEAYTDQPYLVVINRIYTQLIHNIDLQLRLLPQLLPLGHLHARQVVRRVDVSHPPSPHRLLFEVGAAVGLVHVC